MSTIQSYGEYSPSGTGFKVWIKATKHSDKCSKNYADGKVEIFNHGRFFCVTGNRLPTAPLTINAHQAELDSLTAKVWGQAPEPTAARPEINFDSQCDSVMDSESKSESTNENESQSAKPIDYSAISALTTIEQVITIASAASNGDKFKKLWSGDIADYHGKGGGLDHSAADLALMNLLAFYCGKNKPLMVQCFEASGLYRAQGKAADYVSRTADRAIADCRQVFGSKVAADSDSTKDSDNLEQEINGKVPNCFPHTDLGNSERLLFYYSDIIRYVKNYGWIVWNGKVWERNDYKVEQLAKKVVRRIHLEHNACVRKNNNDAFKWAKASESGNKIREMIRLAQSENSITLEVHNLDANRYLLAVQNGTLNLKSGVLQAHNKEDYITKISPVSFDPAATCPTFDSFINGMFDNNQQLVEYVIDVLGYCLSGDINIQRFWIFWGSGENGKSTLMNIAQYVLGEYYYSASTNLLCGDKNEHQTILAALMGKRLVVCAETEKGEKFRTQLIKRLSGDPTITARFLYKDFIEFERQNKTILLTNNLPILTDNGASMNRRLKLIPCTVSVPLAKQNEELGALLQAEASGVLNRLVKGCQRALQSKLKIDPEEVIACTQEYRRESDPIYNFLVDKTEKNPDSWILSSVLYEAYEVYTRELGDKPLDGKLFFEHLGKQGYNPARKNKGRVWTGLQFKVATDNEPAKADKPSDHLDNPFGEPENNSDSPKPYDI